MQTNNIKFLSYFITAIILTLGLSISLQSLMAAWTAPTASPPVCATGDPGCDAPLNISNTAQQKAGMLVLNTGGSANGLIVDSGNVGIGTAAPVAQLDVDGTGDIRLSGVTNWGLETSESPSFQIIDRTNNIRRGVFDTSGDVYFGGSIFSASGGGAALSIKNSGNVGIGTTAPGEKLEVNGNVQADAFLYSSDRNLKKNIQIIPNALDKILQLEGVSFDWKENGKESIGLIAQDVEKIFPELVSTSEITGLKSLQYGNLVAPLIEAIKEQQVQAEEQKEQTEKLKQEIEELKVKIEKLKNK